MWLQKTGAELRELSSYCNCEEGSNERKLSPKIGAAVWGQLLCEEEGGVEGGILDSLLKSGEREREESGDMIIPFNEISNDKF